MNNNSYWKEIDSDIRYCLLLYVKEITLVLIEIFTENTINFLVLLLNPVQAVQGWLQLGRRGVTPLAKYDPPQEL